MKLKKEFKSLEKSAVELTVTIEKAEVESAYKSTLSNYVKHAQIPGFRKGHVPANVLERKYGDSIKADTIGTLIDQSFDEIFKEETDMRPLPYSQPVMDKTPDLDITKDLTYTVHYDVFPKVSVKDFSGVNVKEPQVTVSDDDLAEELKSMQERNAMVIEKKDATVAKDDIVTINYSELGDDGNVIAGSERSDFVFTVGSGENIYKIDDEIIGMKKDETKDITKKYKKDDPDEELAGKTKKIKVTLTALKLRNLPELDDELAQDVNEKFKTLDDLKADIKKNLDSALENRLNEIKTTALIEKLVEKNPIDLPVSMCEAELNSRWRMMARQFQTTTEQLEKIITSSGQTKDQMLSEWKPDVEKALKGRIIIEKLLKDKNITVADTEVEAEYEKIAENASISVEEVNKHYADAQSKEYLVDDLKEQKLYKDLFEKIKVKKGEKKTFADLFKK
ncbi:MAG: trigger factor [Spirochaetaceae bacterium]|nr:trigger factor [Spirochaetaceae bacterium]